MQGVHADLRGRDSAHASGVSRLQRPQQRFCNQQRPRPFICQAPTRNRSPFPRVQHATCDDGMLQHAVCNDFLSFDEPAPTCRFSSSMHAADCRNPTPMQQQMDEKVDRQEMAVLLQVPEFTVGRHQSLLGALLCGGICEMGLASTFAIESRTKKGSELRNSTAINRNTQNY